jgi:hypothetical protein
MIPGLIIGAITVRALYYNIKRAFKDKKATLDAYQAEGRKLGMTEKQAYDWYRKDYRAYALAEHEEMTRRVRVYSFKRCMKIVLWITGVWIVLQCLPMLAEFFYYLKSLF